MGLQGELASETGLALIRAFVDFAGLRYMSLVNSPSFWGMQAMSAGIDTRLTWKIRGNKMALIFSPVIAQGGVALGESGSSDFGAVLFTGEVASKLAFAFQAMNAIFAIYIKGGIEGLWLSRPGDFASDNHHEALATFGLEVRF
jgi:hypothetical protein